MTGSAGSRATEAAKQLQSVISAALPYVASNDKLVIKTLFGDVNPSLIADIWPITSVLALVISAINFNLGRMTKKHVLSLRLCLIGTTLAAISFLFLILIVNNLALSSRPALQEYAFQVAFILLFGGLSRIHPA